jgi:NAD(P)H-flavin reductase
MTAVVPAPTVDSAAPWAAHPVRIRSIKPEAPGVSTYELAFEDPQTAQRFRFEPGQFNMLYLPGIGESAISISSDAAEPGRLLHTIRVVGSVTRALARKRVGDQILLRGPFGSTWPMAACRGKDVVIATGGVGLAPLRPAIYHLVRQRAEFERVILLYGARTPGDLLYTEEYDAWRAAGVEVEVTVDLGGEGWTGQIGVVPTLFYRLRLEAARTRVLTCGPEVMMRFVVFEALARKLRPRDVYMSLERNMNCAVGLCGHCQLGPAFVCKDGPVFTYEQLEPYLAVEDF